jgi:putative addiction module component (TIGR02574 family)
MSTALEVLEAEALKLTPSERSRLMERLLVSLDEDVEIEAAWAAEADRREAELDSGMVTPVSGDQMMERLRARLG